MANKREPKFYVGLIAFLAALAFLILGAAPLQVEFGIIGLFLTEIGILIIAVVPVILFKYDIHEIFPLKRIELRQVFGTLMLWYGALELGSLFIYVSLYIFPDGMSQVVWALNDFFSGAPLPALIISAAVMPAICEEALCRGLIQHSFGGIRRKWITVLIVGLLFGILHLDFYRFLPTMILGLAMAYIMAETGNLLLTMLFHFVNNAWSMLLTWVTAPLTQGLQPENLSLDASVPLSIGISLLMCAVAPWLFIYGAYLLKPKADAPSRPTTRRAKITAIIISVLIAVGGLVLIASQLGSFFSSMQEKITDVTYTKYVSASTEPDVHAITIDDPGSYMLSYSITDPKGDDADGRTHVLMEGADGTVYTDFKANTVFGNTPLSLESGEYTLTFEYEYGYDEAHSEPIEISFSLSKLGFSLPNASATELNAA